VFKPQRPLPGRARLGVVEMQIHIDELCDEHGIELVGSSSRGRAIRERGGRRSISIPEVRGQVSYLVALHEIGHLVGAGRSAPRLEAEANAWLFALQRSRVEPTAATRRSIESRLRSYLDWARRCQHRKHPPRIPERSHPFWALLEGAYQPPVPSASLRRRQNSSRSEAGSGSPTSSS
jgi:hypothetical protein